MSRRHFLVSTGTAAAGLSLSRWAKAETTKSRPLVLGQGEHSYECYHDWITPPSHIKFGDTQGLAQDSHGRIYVAHTVHPESECQDAIAVFDKNGKFLCSWGER